MTLVHYLAELRKRLIVCLLMLSSIFLVLLYFANDLYRLLAHPLLKQLPEGQGLIATHVTSPFFVPFSLTLMVSVFVTVPLFLYHLWAFVAPALYPHEKRFIWPLLFLSTLLFYVGVLFAYFIILPIILQFLTHSAPTGVAVSPDIQAYLDFTLKLLLIFGGIFEVPIITIILIGTNVISREKCIQMRPYAIVGAFILGMFLAPPDVFSQTLMAIPLWLLFEVGIFLAPYFVRKRV